MYVGWKLSANYADRERLVIPRNILVFVQISLDLEVRRMKEVIV